MGFESAEQAEEFVPNPERCRKGVLERGENAPSKESVMRERSISRVSPMSLPKPIFALCPICTAMYQHARQSDDTEIRRLIAENEAPNAPAVEIPVTLAGKQHNLRFVGTHWFDLKIVLESCD